MKTSTHVHRLRGRHPWWLIGLFAIRKQGAQWWLLGLVVPTIGAFVSCVVAIDVHYRTAAPSPVKSSGCPLAPVQTVVCMPAKTVTAEPQTTQLDVCTEAPVIERFTNKAGREYEKTRCGWRPKEDGRGSYPLEW